MADKSSAKRGGAGLICVMMLLGTTAGRAVNYEVYPGSAFYLTQMVDNVSYPYVAQHANGFYFHPVGFTSASDYTLSQVEKQAICDNFSNRLAMVEGDMGGSDPNAALSDIQEIAGFGLQPYTTFINRIAPNAAVWRQTIRNNARLGASTYAMTAPHRIDDVPGGWYDPAYAYARTNTVAVGCAGSGVDAPVYLYANNPAFYRQVIWDQRDYTVGNGKRFNYLVSPNNSYDQELMADTRYLVRTMEDNGHEPDVYGVVLYGLRPVDLTPETTNYNGVVQANWTITGLAYYLLKHRDGEPGDLDLYATSTSSVRHAQNLTAPIVTNASQAVPFAASQSNFFTLTVTNRSLWLDYAAVLRARTAPGQSTNWNIIFRLGSSNITPLVMSDGGYVLLGAQRLFTKTNQQITVSISPKTAPTPLSLVVEALPHAGVDHAMDVIAFQYQTNQTQPTIAIRTVDSSILQGQPLDPIWFTVGDAETLPTTLTVSAASGNPALVPATNCVFGQSGVQRILTVTPVTSQWGMAPITVSVTDGVFTTSKTFNVHVERTNVIQVLKANNTVDLNLTNSWVNNTVPGQFDLPVWTNIVTGPNTVQLGDDQFWAGIRIANPGGVVAIHGTNTLSLGTAGIDMGSASQNLAIHCPLDLEEFGSWNIASGRTLTVSNSVIGPGGIAKSGSGNLQLLATNGFTGQLTVSGGTVSLPMAGQQSFTSISGSAVVRAGSSGSFGLGDLTISCANNDTGRLELSNNISVLAGKTISMNGRNSSIAGLVNVSGTNTVGATISFGTGGGNYWLQSDGGQFTQSGKITFAASGNRAFTVKGAGNGIISGVIENGSATNNVAKSDGGTWTLTANNTYTGTTTVNGGTLLVNGTINSAAPVTVKTNGTLGGNGKILGPVLMQDGGVLQPGNGGIGWLIISNDLTLSGNGVVLMQISKTPKTNDAVVGITDLAYAGTLVVSNSGVSLAPGDSFTLFSATTYSGAFSSLQLPPLDPGIGWSNRLAVDGSISVVVVAPPVLGWQPTHTNTIVFSWPSYYTGYRLQSQTNSLARGLSNNWFNVPNGSNPPVVIRISPTNDTTFFRLAK